MKRFFSEINRRSFLRSSAAAGLAFGVPQELFAQSFSAKAPDDLTWDGGGLRLLLPTVSDTRMLIKASFNAPLPEAPSLNIGNTAVRGVMSDTQGEHWQFYADGLKPRQKYRLSLTGTKGRQLCEPWELSTFPAPEDTPEKFRLLIFSCAGGHEVHQFLPTATRNRLLRRGLSFKPDAMVANGDHIYWDLLAPVGKHLLGMSPEAVKLVGEFNRSDVVLGGSNETMLKRAAGPQIMPVYGTDFRSTPVFFLQDDHDNFDNDEATDEVVTFPPSYFMIAMARATQGMYYPEFLPDNNRPLGLPWSSSSGRPKGVSESFGTLRYGKLAEILMYDCRRTMTLAGPSAVYIDPEVENWLIHRTASSDTEHLVHVPSLPPGWSAGKWGDWYPDVLGKDGKLTIAKPKPYWQAGWVKQHDRLMGAIASQKNRIPLVITGDLHAIAYGEMLRSGNLDFKDNPLNIVLAGPIGCRTNQYGWPSGRRGIGATPSVHVDMKETIPPLEKHGFSIVDFEPGKITLRMFKWDWTSQDVEAIDALQPMFTKEMTRPL